MQSNLSLPSLPGPIGRGGVALDRVLSMGQIELFYIKLFEIKLTDHLTVCRPMSDIQLN